MKRWPIIRHIRYWLLCRELKRYWRRVGRHYWCVVNESDLIYLDRVWKGEA